MSMFRSRVAAAFGILASIHMAVTPAIAAPTPYFRMNVGQDPSAGTPGLSTQNPSGLTVLSGPNGAYKVRIGGRPNAPAASASKSPVAWSVAGDFPPGLTVDSATGAIGGATTTVRDYGPARLVATYTPDKGDPVVANGRDFTVSVIGQPSIAYGASQVVGAGSAVYPNTANLVSPKYTLNQTVPPGLAFDATTGAISVLPGASGTYPNLAVNVVDALDNANIDSNTFSVTVSDRPLSVSLPSLMIRRLPSCVRPQPSPR